MGTTRSEIESLVFLMDDPDEFIRDSVLSRIYELGEASVPLLDEYRAKTQDAGLKSKIKDIIHDITFSGYQQEFISFLDNGIYNLDDLEEGIFLLSRLDDPTMRTRQYKVILDSMAADLEPRIRKATSQTGRMQAVLNYLYTESGFEGCHSDYLNPRHSYLHHVISNRIGIPLSLALVILFLANRLKLPFHGVNMPLHFLVKFESDGGRTLLIDPFNGGGILTKDQCILFLKKSGIKPSDAHFKRSPEIEMFSRFMRNLINGYQQQKNERKAADLARLLGLLETSRL
jgi:regulator of sirC expression with transglutaminase-like and TPR domain